MAEGKTLKEQNAWLIRAAMIGHMAAFGLIAGQPLRLMRLDGPSLAGRLEALAAPGTAALGLIVIASLILLGAINPDWRDRLVLWRWHNPLPGCRAFTQIGPKCSHVDMDRLAGEFGPLPTNSEEQIVSSIKYTAPIATRLAFSTHMEDTLPHATSAR